MRKILFANFYSPSDKICLSCDYLESQRDKKLERDLCYWGVLIWCCYWNLELSLSMLNTFTAFQKDTKLKMFWDISDWYALSLQISVGNISSPSPEVKWPAEYENVSIDVEDSIILNGRFMFKSKTESCKTTK